MQLSIRRALKPLKSRWLVALLVVVLLIAVVPVVHALTTRNSHNRGVIVYVGDSNIVLGAANIVNTTTWNGHTDNGYTPVLVPRVGAGIRTPDCLDTTNCATTDFWATKLGETFTKVQPDYVVVNLGVNDTWSPGTETSLGYYKYPKKIDWFMSQIPAGIKVLWTSLPCSLYQADRQTGCSNINWNLSLATSRWPNLTVLNWQMRAYGHPEYMSADGVHYTSTGHAVWANFVVQALDARLPIPEN